MLSYSLSDPKRKLLTSHSALLRFKSKWATNQNHSIPQSRSTFQLLLFVQSYYFTTHSSYSRALEYVQPCWASFEILYFLWGHPKYYFPNDRKSKCKFSLLLLLQTEKLSVAGMLAHHGWIGHRKNTVGTCVFDVLKKRVTSSISYVKGLENACNLPK